MKKMMKDEEIELDLSEVLAHINQNGGLPDPEMLNFYKLQKERKIWFDLQVDASTLEFERQIMLWNMEDMLVPPEQRKPIWLYLFNYGGSFDLEWSFIDMIDMSITPIYTVNMGVCASAAADIFLAGKKRFMVKNGRVMIHQGSGGFQGDSNKIFNAVDDYKRQLEKTKKYILDRTKITSAAYKKHETDDWWLTADECLKYGVCDKLVETFDEIL